MIFAVNEQVEVRIRYAYSSPLDVPAHWTKGFVVRDCGGRVTVVIPGWKVVVVNEEDVRRPVDREKIVATARRWLEQAVALLKELD